MVNSILWHDAVLYGVLAVGVLFTIWSGFAQYQSLTHGVQLVRGRFARQGAPGALSHFQALSTALSATVGLGNIAGVAIAVSLGGPGAVFWMWVTGFIGMALKSTEVTQAMLYRDVSNPDDPHGGAMYVASRGFPLLSARLAGFGRGVGGLFCITLLISAFTGGNMFQAWNVADITWSYFGVPKLATGLIIATVVAAVILGGIRRIGSVTERLVPFMCLGYLAAGVLALALRIDQIPAILQLIVTSAFRPAEAQQAFLGGSLGWAFLKGMQRALFSNEAGQGSSPIAHSAVRTDEPVSEGVVAGLEPFIDTLVVCTVTALVLLSSGIWNRSPDLQLEGEPRIVETTAGSWSLTGLRPAAGDDRDLRDGEPICMIVSGDSNASTGNRLHRWSGRIDRSDRAAARITWDVLESRAPPSLVSDGAYYEYKGATLTARAFDRVVGGLGGWLVPLTAWLFAISTIISWSYYGEQAVVYLLQKRAVRPYRWLYCGLILVSTTPLISSEVELDSLSTLGTGVMLAVNLPLMLVFGRQAMRAQRAYRQRLKDRERKDQ